MFGARSRIDGPFRIGQMELDAGIILGRVYAIGQREQLALDTGIKLSNTSKYKFHTNSNYSCNYCFEKFVANQTMCFSLCCHFWCADCDEQIKIKKNKCGFCRCPIEPHEFIDTFGNSGMFKKTTQTSLFIQIIKDDIDSIQIDENIYINEDEDYNISEDYTQMNSLD